MPPALPPGEHLLALGVDQNGARRESTQNVTVSVPVKSAALAKEEAKPLIALSEPDKPTRLLSEPANPNAPAQQAKLEPQAPAANAGAANAGAANSPASTPANLLRFRIVEADEKGAFFASGYGPSGGLIRLYLNDALVATVTVGPDQQWSLKIEKGLIKGTYRVRADLIASADGSVVARVEVPFDYTPVIAIAPVEALPPSQAPAQVKPAEMAAAPPTAGVQAPAASANPAPSAAPSAAPANAAPTTSGGVPAPMPAAPDLANVVVKEIATVTVTRGDNLWRISRKLLGRGTRYTQIYEANTSQIRDPSLIYPNQVLVMPNKLD
ncbi:MAG: LysM peptidoglycan-binding domain-containing protein [Alphaproteobacteria bacterium]|nr:LysM peptidoglycan-binding domain-containing protein [Alphaproteobacteria bacterium]